MLKRLKNLHVSVMLTLKLEVWTGLGQSGTAHRVLIARLVGSGVIRSGLLWRLR